MRSRDSASPAPTPACLPPPPSPHAQVVESHFSARAKLSDMRTKLEDRAMQFRNVEKRLLMRFKVGGRVGCVCVWGGGRRTGSPAAAASKPASMQRQCWHAL